MKRISLKKQGLIIAFGIFVLHAYGQADLQNRRQTAPALSSPSAQLSANRENLVLTDEKELPNADLDSMRIVHEKQQVPIIAVRDQAEESNSKPKKEPRVNWFGKYLLAKIAGKFNE